MHYVYLYNSKYRSLAPASILEIRQRRSFLGQDTTVSCSDEKTNQFWGVLYAAIHLNAAQCKEDIEKTGK
jgi:hypothetical protein